MLAQRPVGAAPAVQATAEALPFADGAFDAAMAVLSDHHWPDRAAGLRELRRVARRRAVVFQCDLEPMMDFWLVRDYLTTFREAGMPMAELAGHLGAQRIEPVPIPHDCRDGFFVAYWRRPHAYLDPRVRDGISVFRLLPAGRGRRGDRAPARGPRVGRVGPPQRAICSSASSSTSASAWSSRSTD